MRVISFMTAPLLLLGAMQVCGAEDSYDPGGNQLTIQSVTV